LGKVRFFGQLEIAQCLARAVRRAGLHAAYTKGFHPHLKLSFSDALPVGLESLVAEARLTLNEWVDPETIRVELNRHLPEGMRVERVARLGTRRTEAQNRRVTCRVTDLAPLVARGLVQNWRRDLSGTIVKKTKRGEVRAALGDILLDVRQLDETSLEMDLFEGMQTCFRPMAVLEHLLGESTDQLRWCRVCETASTRVAGLEGSEDVGRTHNQR
jgi:radical SAM-linked protein